MHGDDMGKNKRWDSHVAKKIEHMLSAAAAKHCSPAGTEGKRGAWAEVQALLAALDLAGAAPLSNAATKILLSVSKPGISADIAAAALLIEDLAQCGARLNERDAAGSTALHYQAASGSASVVDVLISKGADPSARDAAGATPGQLAADAGHAALAASLEAARLSKEEASALHGDALWIINCEARKDGGAESISMAMAFELSGDQARRLRSADLSPGAYVIADPSNHLAPFGSNEMCRHAFKGWSGLAKSASPGKPSIHAGDPATDGFGRVAIQSLTINVFRSANLPGQEEFEALGRHIAAKSGAASWSVEPLSSGEQKRLESLSEFALRSFHGTSAANVSGAVKEVAAAARAKLERTIMDGDVPAAKPSLPKRKASSL